MSTSPYQHMEEAWGLDQNPFPHSAISGGWMDPYSSEVFPNEEAEFFEENGPRGTSGQSTGRLSLEQRPWRRHWLRQDGSHARVSPQDKR